jgi:nucleotidyltransferase substrate binding protein (TIGR01987 family)
MVDQIINVSILKKSVETLRDAWTALQQTNDVKLRDIMMDSCVKRFEYTMETAWKIMKKFLKFTYGRDDRELTINNIFRLMAGYGFIDSWEKWREYYARRNDTAHEYNIEKAHELIKIIPEFIGDVGTLITNLSLAVGDGK